MAPWVKRLASTGRRWTTLCLLLPALGACGSGGDPSRQSGHARLYATVSGTAELLALDETAHQQVARWEVGAGPAILLQAPSTGKLYTANWLDASVSAVDPTKSASTTIALAGRPYVIAMAPAGDYVYAGVNPTGIAIIDTTADAVLRTLPTTELAASIVVSPDGQTLYVATFSGTAPGKVRAIAAADGALVHAPLTVGSAPAWLCIHPSGDRVYALNFQSDDISVVDTRSWRVVATIATGAGSQAIIGAVSADGSRLYVTNHGTGELMGIDTDTNAIASTIALDARPVGVALSADASRAVVTDFGAGSLQAPIDVSYLLTGRLTTTTPGQIRVYDTASGAVLGPKAVTGPGPTSVVIGATP